VPLVLTLVGDGGLVAKAEWQFPKPKVVYDDILEEDNWYLLGKFVVSRAFAVPADLTPGRYRVYGEVSGQYCDDDGCIQFDRKRVSVQDRKFGWVAWLNVAGEPVAATAPVAPEKPRDAKDKHGFYLDFDYAMAEAKRLNKPLLVDFNGVT
jgi:hypothetical protein